MENKPEYNPDNPEIVLSKRDFKLLLKMLEEGREPNEKLKKAFEMHKKQVKQSEQ